MPTDKSTDPRTWLHVSFPTDGNTKVTDPAANSFANGPHWGEATAYADLVAARQGTRLSLQAGSTFIGSISRATCDGGGSTPAESATNDALLEHLRTTGADFC